MIDVDIETRASLNVVEHGLYRHAPTADILLMWYRIDRGPWTEYRGYFADGENADCSDDPPQDFIAALRAGKMVRAWNAGYERVVLSEQPWCPVIPPEQTICLAAWAATFNLPRSLQACSRMLLPADRVKLGAVGKKLDYMWDADKPLHSASDMDKQSEYCLRDCEAMADIYDLLPDVTDQWLAQYHANEHINDRGMALDTQLAGAVVAMKPAIDAALVAEIHNAAGEEIKLRGPSLLKWLERELPEELQECLTIVDKKREGYAFKSVKRRSSGKAARKQLMAAMDDWHGMDDVRRLLRAYEEANKAAVGKFSAAIDRVSSDDRLRGQYVFQGAGQTGRFSSTGVQVHNLKRDVADNVTEVIETLIRHRNAPGAVAKSLGMTANVAASEVLRPMFIAPQGKTVYWCDWSSIEARVLPWLTAAPSAEKVLDVFRADGDVYKVEASGIYNVPVAEIDKDQRQIGKVACLAGDTMVLTKDPLQHITTTPISLVTETHMVWDGVTWVRHAGLVYKGEARCATLSGMKLTPDHLIWCGSSQQWMPAAQVKSNEKIRSLASEIALGSLLLAGISLGPKAVSSPSSSSATVGVQNMRSRITISLERDLRDATTARKSSPQTLGRRNICIMPGRVMMSRIAHVCSTASRLFNLAATTPTIANGWPMAGAASPAGGRMNTVMSASVRRLGPGGCKPCAGNTTCWPTWSRLTAGTSRNWSLTASTMMQAMRRAIFGSSPKRETCATNVTSMPCPSASSNLSEKMPVYDLVNAGPRSRFTVITDDGPLIVHNCLSMGYQGGVNAFQSMAANYGVAMTDDQAEGIKTAWRRANRWAVEFWADLEAGAMEAIETPGRQVDVGRVTYQFIPDLLRGTLLCWLPDGGWISYPEARIVDVPKFDGEVVEPGIVFMHPTYGPSTTYGGALAENVTQAVAACLLRRALVMCEDAGLEIVGSVHDEIIGEAHEDEVRWAGADLERIMLDVPSWAKGLPLACEVEMGPRYKVVA